MRRGKRAAEDTFTETPQDQILKTEYSELMQKSYIDYAMSVIVARALPDVRDGLKPVQRRTLYDMHELGIRSDKPFRKSARIVGDTMGKYHPHGDSSIYESLVVMAQDFKKGLPLINGHGNFGNIEGDGAAAMRYTEARLQEVTEEAFLADLDKDVVDFVPNFDENEKEPAVLPVKIPNFLINGSEGIAVGMATNTPPHNLAEVIDAQIALMEDPALTNKDLMRYVKGPDFPTGGIVVNKNDLPEIYETGVGKVRLRGRTEIEKGRAGHVNLVITEIPYTMVGAGIGKFLSDVAALAEKKVTNDIIDITNQSDKEGIRIVIELRKDTDVENFKNLLYKKTRLEDTFGVNMLAIRDGRPETLSLREILKANTDFLYETTTRKYENLLEKERKKREIQEGLIKAVNVIDLIIEILRGARDRKTVKNCLVNGETGGIKFRSEESEIMATQLAFTEAQADAILDMRLYKLIGLELEALIKEHDETVANIYRYEDILEEHDSMTRVLRGELTQIRDKYARDRRTEIIQAEAAVYTVKEDEEDRDLLFVMDRFGYAKTMDPSLYEKNKEAVESGYKYYFICRSAGRICLFTNTGVLHTVKVSDLPMGKLRDKGVPIDNVGNYDSTKEEIVMACSQSDLNLYRLLFVTANGYVKIVSGGEFETRMKTMNATKLADGDSLVYAGVITDEKYAVLISRNGYLLKFPLEQISEMKKTAAGMQGMKLGKEDLVEKAIMIHDKEAEPLVYKETEVDLNRVRTSVRNGKGTKRF
ncbi:MAG: DNA topoisomerase 4 subunit A [Lachnospiraceae bacterium]|jgi:DNA gyrase subunit A|nr:DNA topoisomerase 4 subunit A [Lachnospiraceae bacterium]